MQFERRTEASASARLLRPDSRESDEGPNSREKGVNHGIYVRNSLSRARREEMRQGRESKRSRTAAKPSA